MIKIILATGSKQRKDVFNMTGIKYDVIKSKVEENSASTNPSDYVSDISKAKADSVAKQINEKAIIISGDSVIFLGNRILTKPKTKEEAYKDLKAMSGRTVEAYTATTIKDLYKNKEITFVDKVDVTFNCITDEEIKWYVENEKKIYDICGCVILGKASLFLKKVDGDYNTFFGISPSKLYNKLKELGYRLEDFELK